jgi:hypothetical protein
MNVYKNIIWGTFALRFRVYKYLKYNVKQYLYATSILNNLSVLEMFRNIFAASYIQLY